MPSILAGQEESRKPRKRLVVMFSPNGTLPVEFWPDQLGADVPLELKPMLAPLQPFQDQILMLKGVNNKIRGWRWPHARHVVSTDRHRAESGKYPRWLRLRPVGRAALLLIKSVRNYFQSQEKHELDLVLWNSAWLFLIGSIHGHECVTPGTTNLWPQSMIRHRCLKSPLRRRSRQRGHCQCSRLRSR